MAGFDPDILSDYSLCVVITCTWEGGTPPPSAVPFVLWLIDEARDFRVHKTQLAHMRYAVVGLGNSLYGNNFGKCARDIDAALRSLSATAILPLTLLDQDSSRDMRLQFDDWTQKFWSSQHGDFSRSQPHTLPSDAPSATDRHLLSQGASKTKNEGDSLIESESEDDEHETEMVDVEDLGGYLKRNLNTAADTAKDDGVVTSETPLALLTKEMVTPSLRKALTKQGYRLLGSHSGVKLCRWTKAMLRGRGGCYKHTFYGITSYRCMEMTTSLACANKCIFCWRHHKNPVGKSWQWKVDAPEILLDQALQQHRLMIRECRGVPGVTAERLAEADMPRHCALSLVGEPIIYPYINQFIGLLHQKGISTFLVTNAQFPEKIEQLRPVTQLYVSVDAATKETLKAVDRPLFEDFWERFLKSIDALSKKGQRTVFRLTLIKEWNMSEIENYAALVKRGKPDFIEVKGMTYCGTSKASPLRITNAPFHDEVLRFTQELCAASNKAIGEPLYELACEHEHSCCVLIANVKKFKVNNEWWTWIDYDKFHELVRRGQSFTSVDYRERTPDWALVGSPERGFDPGEVRYQRKKPKPPTQGC